jgi:formylglycine-generating enzyme required for sulfatase activity
MARSWLVPSLLLASLAACSWLVSLDGLSGGGAPDAGGGDGRGAVNPSCSGGGTGAGNDCGDGTVYCCDAVAIPGGTFNRSNDPGSPATVSAFLLDRYEVTVGRFRRFVDANGGTVQAPPAEGAGAHPNIPGSGWQSAFNQFLAATPAELKANLACGPQPSSWTDTPGANERLPIDCIDWFTAFAFCIWDGGRLATEAEFNFAAAGGAEQRIYPWSTPPSSTTLDPTYAVYGCSDDGGTCLLSDLPPVGSRSPKGDAKWGNADMSGSVNEWTLDIYDPSYVVPCTDCAALGGDGGRVERGEDWIRSNVLRTVSRDSDYPTVFNPGKGIRCAR